MAFIRKEPVRQIKIPVNYITMNQINSATPNNVSRAGVFVGFENNITISCNSISEVASSVSTEDVFGISLGTNSISTTSLAGNEVKDELSRKIKLGQSFKQHRLHHVEYMWHQLQLGIT